MPLGLRRNDGTNNAFVSKTSRQSRGPARRPRAERPAFAIVTRDSILIDEAALRSSLAPRGEQRALVKINALVPRFRRQETEEGEGDFYADEKSRQVHLSESGFEKAEELMQEAGLLREGESLYDPASIRLMHHLNAALRAHNLYQKDVEYIVRGADVIIVDEFTGRTGRAALVGRTEPAVEAGGVEIRGKQPRGHPLQNISALRKLAGMTARRHRGLRIPADLRHEVVVVPTHGPWSQGHGGLVYRTNRQVEAIVEDIAIVKRGQPGSSARPSIETPRTCPAPEAVRDRAAC